MIRHRLAAAAVGAVLALVPALAVPAFAAPGPAQAPEYWFDDWGVPQLWSAGARGQGVVIAEVDTGVNASLPELSGKILSGKDFGAGGNGHVDRDEQAFGHGTAMASIMVASPGTRGITGLAPDAKILPVAVPLRGTTDASGDDHLAAAIRWSVDHGARVVSMSLGGIRQQSDDPDSCPSTVQDAIYYALRKGAVLLAASGNRGAEDNAVEEPGVCLGVVTVGAVNAAGTVASFSSRHAYLTLTAPGVDIASLSRVPGAAYSGNGTSQATAITAAVVALVWSKYPKLTGRAVVTRLLATLRHNAATSGGAHSSAYGYGSLDAAAAVTARVPATAANPVYSSVEPFLSRQSALAGARAPAAPSPAATAPPVAGAFVRDSAPQQPDGQAVLGLAVGSAGLLALLLLVLVGVRGRRSSRAGVAADSAGAPPLFDDGGLVWHEIGDAAYPAYPQDDSTRGPVN